VVQVGVAVHRHYKMVVKNIRVLELFVFVTQLTISFLFF